MTKVAIFEDEPILQLMWENISEEAGFGVAGVCNSIGTCNDLAKFGVFDVAILDVDLEGRSSEPLLRILERRNKLVLVCTGIEIEELPDGFLVHEMIHKPFPTSMAVRKLGEMARSMSLV